MNRLNRTQKDKMQQFRTITGASERAAQTCLQVRVGSTESTSAVDGSQNFHAD